MKLCPFLPLALAVMVSCSVKEDRRVCPCVLEVAATFPSVGNVIDIAGFDSGDRFMFDRLKKDEFPSYYHRETRRCFMSVVCALADKPIVYGDGGRIVSIEKGMQADSLFAGVEQVDATGETAISHVTLHKQFSSINISMWPEREDSGRYRLVLQGTCAGLDVLSLSPIAGEYFFETEFERSGTTVRIMRMNKMSDLTASLVDCDSGENIHNFAIGQMMTEAGYDYQATDLQDVDISISATDFSCAVEVIDWTRNVIVIDI